MSQVPIAIVGVSALFAGSTDAKGFWRPIIMLKPPVTLSLWVPTVSADTTSSKKAFL